MKISGQLNALLAALAMFGGGCSSDSSGTSGKTGGTGSPSAGETAVGGTMSSGGVVGTGGATGGQIVSGGRVDTGGTPGGGGTFTLDEVDEIERGGFEVVVLRVVRGAERTAPA